MKRLTIALTAIGFSMGSFAALPASTDPTAVVVPQLAGGFVAGVTGYYLQPSDSHGDLDFALNSINANTVLIKNVEPSYDWGFGVNVGYIFSGTGNDVNLSYFHLDTNENDSLSGPGVVPIAGINTAGFLTNVIDEIANLPGFAGANIDYFNTGANGSVDHDINQVDLTFGQYVDIGCRLTLHGYVGGRWLSLDRDLNTEVKTAANGVFVEAPIPKNAPSQQLFIPFKSSEYAYTSEKSDFNGIGPIVGLDSSYYLGAGFGFVGHFDSALLIGNIDSKINSNAKGSITINPDTADASEVPLNFAVASETDSTRRIVPVLDAKLGLDYTFVFNNTSNSDLTLEAGWQVSKYFNAIDRNVLSVIPTIVNSNVVLSSVGISHSTSNLGIDGPYASLVVRI